MVVSLVGLQSLGVGGRRLLELALGEEGISEYTLSVGGVDVIPLVGLLGRGDGSIRVKGNSFVGRYRYLWASCKG